MLTKDEIICIFESTLPIKELSKNYNIKPDLIVSIQIGLYGAKFTEDLIPGRIKRFEKRVNKNSKLELEEVEFIISSTRTQRSLAKLFNVSKDNIYDIKNNKTWKQVDRTKRKDSIRPIYYGEQTNSHKLTTEEVTEILKLINTETNTAIAKKFNVSKGAISAIKVNKTWTHLPRPYIYTKQKYESGINHYNSKITVPMLREIMRNKGPLKILAKKFNLATSTICRVRQKYSRKGQLCYNSLKSANNL